MKEKRLLTVAVTAAARTTNAVKAVARNCMAWWGQLVARVDVKIPSLESEEKREESRQWLIHRRQVYSRQSEKDTIPFGYYFTILI